MESANPILLFLLQAVIIFIPTFILDFIVTLIINRNTALQRIIITTVVAIIFYYFLEADLLKIQIAWLIIIIFYALPIASKGIIISVITFLLTFAILSYLFFTISPYPLLNFVISFIVSVAFATRIFIVERKKSQNIESAESSDVQNENLPPQEDINIIKNEMLCTNCSFYNSKLKICEKFHFNITTSPNVYHKKCNGEYFLESD